MLHITNTAEALANNVEHFFVCLELSSQRGVTEYAGKVAGSNKKRSHHHITTMLSKGGQGVVKNTFSNNRFLDKG